jgi:predicted CXXCH cytochrome family protein
MKRAATIFVLVLLLCAAPSALGAPPVTRKVARPTAAVEPAGCVTAECHANVKAYPVVHAPIEMNACDACHKATDVTKHTFTARREGADACKFCHEFDLTGIPVVHLPVTRGECLGCHNPHGGADRRMTREQGVAQMCARCHDDVKRDRTHAHDPVAKGSCDACHTSHASRYPGLLYAEGEALCLSCHDKLQSRLVEARFRHEALKDGCGTCHESHASNLPKQLKRNAPELCTESCHENVKRVAATARYPHTVVNNGRACLTCHTPHGGDLGGLMADLPLNLCMSCHAQKQKTDRGRVIAALPELKDPNTFKHGPIEDGQCAACHESHGSERPMLLARENSSAFYQPLAEENYRLCFSCHDIGMGMRKQTHTATQFRNGEINLHFVHTNRGTRGRNCRACHNTHASANPDHVNERLQFGKWEMPINFTKTATGGTCQTGCHPEWRYDRVIPATRPTTRATTGPSTAAIVEVAPTPAAREAATEKPAPVQRREVMTASGKRLAVPLADRPTVLVFTRAAHAQQQDLFRLITAAVPDERRAGVILVIVGDRAGEEASRMAAAGKEVRWPVVADADDAVFGDLRVHVWPTTMVVASDGAQVGRFAGAPQSLRVSLPAYIDLAAGRIDRAALARRLTPKTGVGDTPERKAAREVQAIARLIEAGDGAGARKRAEAARMEFPESAALKVQWAAALLQDGYPWRAIEVLDRLPAEALRPGERELLRARALLAADRWREARAALEASILEDPAVAEAHYLMGRVYEHEGDWVKAAKAYRAAREVAEPRGQE